MSTDNYLINSETNRIEFLDSRFYRDTRTGAMVPSVTTLLEAWPKGAQYYEWLKKNGENADAIRDEAGRELTEDEVRGALSLVSSGAADADSEGGDAPDQIRDTGDPPTGQPGVDDRGVDTRRWPKEDLLNTDSPRPESTQSARAFSDVRAVWPSSHVLSLVACENIHAGLIDPDKEAAFRGTRPYLDDCKAQNRKVCDLATYYRERRWERFLNKGPVPEFYVVLRATPQAARWREWLTENEPRKLNTFERAIGGRGWTAPSEWPPARAAHATDPPSDLSDDDSRELLKL